VQAFKESIDATEYLKYFKTRLYTGMGVSAVDMGEGDTANRSTADNISQNLKARVIEDQKTFASQVQFHFFVDLFLEHPEEVSALNSFDQVKLVFANVDLDSRIKWENHVIQLWNSNLIDEDEARARIHLRPMDPNAPTHFQRVEAPLAIIGAVDEPFTAEAKKAAQKRLTGTEEPAAAGRPKGGGSPPAIRRATRPVAQKSRPTNQRGTNLGPTRRRSNTEEKLLGRKLFLFTNSVVRSIDENDIVSVINDHFTSLADRELILSIVREAMKDAGSIQGIRAHLVPRLMGAAYKFPDS
jgi:hypothetical protein